MLTGQEDGERDYRPVCVRERQRVSRGQGGGKHCEQEGVCRKCRLPITDGP